MVGQLWGIWYVCVDRGSGAVMWPELESGGAVSGTGLFGVCPGPRQTNQEDRRHWKASTAAAATRTMGKFPFGKH